MASWKLQCHFCKDTVSTGKLNRNYYKLHLEAVHNINQNCERLLSWALSQQNVGESGGGGAASTISTVANILNMKGITIERSKDSGGAAGAVPGSLINIKGITVQKVSDGGPGGGGRGQAGPGGPNAQQNSAILRQQELAINRWANGCEHGCRLCKRDGKHFISFARQGLLKHLDAEHSISERDYKDEFKLHNLITRASNMTCKECKAKVKRLPSSLNTHFKKHNMNLRQYWLKHLKPPNMPGMNGIPRGGGAAQLRGRANWVRGGMRGGLQRQGGGGGGGGGAPGSYRCGINTCERSFDNHQALALHRAWHARAGSAGRGGGGAGSNKLEPKVMLNRVDQATIDREQAGLGGDDAMEVELDPLTLLEMGMGEDNIEIEGEAVKEEPPDTMEEEEEGEEREENPSEQPQGDERDLHTPQPESEEKSNSSMNGDNEDGEGGVGEEEEGDGNAKQDRANEKDLEANYLLA